MVEFLTPGQRIRKLRKLLNMNQKDLEGRKLKRNFISMIENGKRRLSNETAQYLAEKFNKRAKELKIKLCIDESYLLMPQDEEARQYCLNKLSENPNLNTIDSTIDISIKYNLNDVEMHALIKRGDYYFGRKEYSKALTCYINSLNKNNSIYNQFEPYIFNKLGLCKMNEMYYSEALELFNKAYSLSIANNDLLTSKNSIYNISLCYRKLFNFELSIKYIDEYLSLCNKDEEFTNFVYANIIKANSYRDLKEYENALRIYNNLLELFINVTNSTLAYVYDNLGLLYSECLEYEKALEYLDLSQKIRTEIDIENLSKSLIDKASILSKQKKNNEALILVKLGLDMSKKYNDSEYELKGYYLLLDIYKEEGNIRNLEEIYLNIFNIVKQKKDYKEVLDISNKLCLIYLDENNIEKAKSILKSNY